MRIERFLRDRLETLREKNDRHQSAEDTAAIRGEIKAVKALIAIGEERPEFKKSPAGKRSQPE